MKTVRIKETGHVKILPGWVADSLIKKGEATLSRQPKETKKSAEPSKTEEPKPVESAIARKGSKKTVENKELKTEKADK